MDESPCLSCGAPCRASDRFCSQCGRRDPISPAEVGKRPNDSGSFATFVSESTVTAPYARIADPPLGIGSLFARRYRIERLIGEGGMGRVYLATDMTIFEPIALKFVSRAHRSDPGILDQFKRELKLARRIRHRNVVASFHLGEAEGRTYITQEYIDADSLSAVLSRGGPLEEAAALRILRQVLYGLKAAHDLGIVHRDIKASNILVNKDGVAFITDFGLAISMAQAHGLPMAGTPQYMAPELFHGAVPTPCTDFYACGVLLYHMLTGRFPFGGRGVDTLAIAHHTRAPALIPEESPVSALTRQLYARALAKVPEMRPQRAIDMLDVCDRVLALDALSVKTERPIALVADSDERVRLAARDQLEEEGYHVETAADANRMIELAFSIGPSFVVLDSDVEGGQEIAFSLDTAHAVQQDIVPRHRGLAACRLLQHDVRLQRVPVLVVAAEPHARLRQAFLLMGASELIGKPFTREEFAAGVRAARHAALEREEES